MERSIRRRIVTWACAIAIVLAGTMCILVYNARRGAKRNTEAGRLQQLFGAFLNYEEIHGRFPPASVADHTGRPAHSWRVLLLPFLGHDALYREYDFREPWDGPHNRRLWGRMPDVFHCARSSDAEHTCFVAIIDDHGFWRNNGEVRASHVKDGLIVSVMFVRHPDSDIRWTEPRDLDWADLKASINQAKGDSGAKMLFMFGSGMAREIPLELGADRIHGIITIDGGEDVAALGIFKD